MADPNHVDLLQQIAPIVQQGIEKSRSTIETALYVGGGAVLTTIAGAFGAVWAMVRKLGTRLDKAHGTHVELLKGQIDSLLTQVNELEQRLANTHESMIEQAANHTEQQVSHVEKTVTAVAASTEAINRVDRSNQSVVEMVRAVHHDLRSLQETVLRRIGG